DIIDGDFVSNEPEIVFQIDYEGPFPIDDTTAVRYYLDNKPIPYSAMQVEHDSVNQSIRSTYRPPLENGDHFIKIASEAFNLDRFFTVSNELKIVDLYNYPNPFSDETAFTFKLTRIPEEVIIKIYTVAGRLIKNIYLTSSDLKTDFNKIEWDGRDEDGDKIANGVYLYKVILKDQDESQSYTQKLAVMR
ncbi:MAG: FlgD immunoglobulin-like domain containing protein, partial [Bacteroidota bacterium]